MYDLVAGWIQSWDMKCLNLPFTFITDINECTDGSADCRSGAECINLNGSFACQCRAGFQEAGNNCTGAYFVRSKLP